MTATVGTSTKKGRSKAPLTPARARRESLRRAAIWGQVGWAGFMFGSAALALGIAGVVRNIEPWGSIALALWVVLYGVTVYSVRAAARARGDRTLQEHIARVQRTRYLRKYPPQKAQV